MKENKTLYLTQSALIAALYIVLTQVSNSVGLASGVIQIRLSEMLTILPVFTKAAVPGLYIGCLISNLLTGGTIIDVLLGSLTTLAAAYVSYAIRKYKYVAVLPPIVFNAVAIPFILRYAYVGIKDSIPFLMLTVGIGQIISCGILGSLLLYTLNKYKGIIPFIGGTNKDS